MRKTIDAVLGFVGEHWPPLVVCVLALGLIIGGCAGIAYTIEDAERKTGEMPTSIELKIRNMQAQEEIAKQLGRIADALEAERSKP